MEAAYWVTRYQVERPDRLGPVTGFHDLAPLFSCTPASRGFVQLDIDEGAYLYAVAAERRRCCDSPRAIEVGRARGGSTVILAAGVGAMGHVTSIDVAPADDEYLVGLLERAHLAGRVTLLRGDSRSIDLAETRFDVAFIDGDHEYDGVRADWERVKGRMRPGGIVLFHDATSTRPSNSAAPGCARVANEIEKSEAGGWHRLPDVGTIASFRLGQPEGAGLTDDPKPPNAASAV